MTNNEVFNFLLNLTGLFKDTEKVQYIFELGGLDFCPSKAQISRWMKTKDHRANTMQDETLHCFKQGLFMYRDLQASKGVQVFNFGINFGNDK